MPLRVLALWIVLSGVVIPAVTADDLLRPPTYQPGREYVIRSVQTVETVLAVAGGQQQKKWAASKDQPY